MKERYNELLEALGLEPTPENRAAVMRWHSSHLHRMTQDFNAYTAAAMSDLGVSAMSVCQVVGINQLTVYYWRQRFPQTALNVMNVERTLIDLAVEAGL